MYVKVSELVTTVLCQSVTDGLVLCGTSQVRARQTCPILLITNCNSSLFQSVYKLFHTGQQRTETGNIIKNRLDTLFLKNKTLVQYINKNMKIYQFKPSVVPGRVKGLTCVLRFCDITRTNTLHIIQTGSRRRHQSRDGRRVANMWFTHNTRVILYHHVN